MKYCLLCLRDFEGATCPYCGEATFMEKPVVTAQEHVVPEPVPEVKKPPKGRK